MIRHIFRFGLTVAAAGALAAHAAPLQLQVLSATVRDQGVAGAEVLLQKNGQQSVHGYSDAQGSFQGAVGFADDADTTLILRKDGYSTLVAKCPCNGLTYAVSPVLRQLDAVRVVLDWGQHPDDLDLHLVNGTQHIFWNTPQGDEAGLDVDHRQGFGPETITIHNRHPGQRYVFAVHDYSDRDGSGGNAMELSAARVWVYIGQTLVRSYSIDPARRGNLWTVFALDGDGVLQDLDRYADLHDPGAIPAALSQAAAQTATAAPQASDEAKARAQAYNRDGETAYGRKDYDTAIGLFQAAVALDPNYGQAWSNLGLTFDKAGSKAEAIWADRKAITLAGGADAARVRASSWFNIARIYEAGGEWAKALDSYQAAEAQRHNEIYVKAIARMRAQPS